MNPNHSILYRSFHPLLRAIRFNVLKARLLLGTSCILIVILATGLFVIHSSHQLSDSIRIVFDENFRLAKALEDIQDSAGKLNGAFVLMLAGERELSREISEEYLDKLGALHEDIDRRFQVIDQETRENLNRLNMKIGAVLGLAEDSFQIGEDGFHADELIRGYARDLGPLLLEVSDLASEIQTWNEGDFAGWQDRSQARLVHLIRSILLAMIVVMVVLLYFTYRMAYSVFQPIQRLTRSVRQLGRGNLDQEIPVFSRDEIGLLSKSLNRLTSNIRSYQERTSAKLVRMYQTIEMTLAALPHPIFILDADCRIEFLNSSARRLLGDRDGDEDSRLPSPLREKVEEVTEAGKHLNPYRLTEALRITAPDRDRYFIPRILLLRDQVEKVFGVAVILEDVTDLRISDEMKTNFVSTVNHELKTPLTGARMSLHLLKKKVINRLNGEECELLDTAYADTEKLYHTLNNLLDITRAEEEELKQRCSIWDPKEMLGEIVERAVATVPEQDVVVDLEIDEDVPPLQADRKQIEIVFVNLLTNAIKYSGPGSRVMVRGRCLDSGAVRISVIDTGPGISSEHQERIFERFFRVPGQSENGGGIGLSIAQRLVELQGARIRVRSERGKGAEFFVDFPPDTIAVCRSGEGVSGQQEVRAGG